MLNGRTPLCKTLKARPFDAAGADYREVQPETVAWGVGINPQHTSRGCRADRVVTTGPVAFTGAGRVGLGGNVTTPEVRLLLGSVTRGAPNER